MIIEPPSKSPPEMTTLFEPLQETSSILDTGDSTSRNFYMRLDGTYHDGESTYDTSIPPAVICRLGERSPPHFVEVYDRNARIVKLRC
jgi:hypothetical protein